MWRTLLKLLLQGPMKEVNDKRFYLSAKCSQSSSSSFVSKTEIILMQQVVIKFACVRTLTECKQMGLDICRIGNLIS